MTNEELKSWRERSGMGRESMARYLGVSVHVWNKWENGQRSPSGAAVRLFEVLQLAEVLCPDMVAQFKQ